MKLPKAIEKVIESFERLPGVGPKSAQRLAFYLLHVSQEELDSFAQSVSNLKKNTVQCDTCFNTGETNPCWVCSDLERDPGLICIVEDALDLLAIEKSGKYTGVYHVLHGVIDPLHSIGPDDIFIPQLVKRVKEQGVRGQGTGISEIILATNPTMEGDATAMYITRDIKDINPGVKITRIGRGLPIGADLEYADEITIERALEGRREY